MSGDLGNRDYHLYKICDGTAVKPVYAVVPVHRRSLAGRLARAGYGTLAVFREVLVRRNPAHDAFNLLVDRRAEVEFPSEGTPGRHRSHRAPEGPGRSRRT
jgi:hypothetical protein